MRLLRTILPILVTISVIGCYTERKANKELNKALQTYPVMASGIIKDRFPCKSVIIDTLLKSDTLYDFIDCPEQPKQIQNIFDTIENVIVIKKYVPKKVISKIIVTKTIEKLIKDSAEIFNCQGKLDNSNKEKDKYKNLYDVWFKIAIALFIMLLITFSIMIYESKSKLH